MVQWQLAQCQFTIAAIYCCSIEHSKSDWMLPLFAQDDNLRAIGCPTCVGCTESFHGKNSADPIGRCNSICNGLWSWTNDALGMCKGTRSNQRVIWHNLATLFSLFESSFQPLWRYGVRTSDLPFKLDSEAPVSCYAFFHTGWIYLSHPQRVACPVFCPLTGMIFGCYQLLCFFSLREYGCGAFVVKLQDAISHPVLQSLGLKVQTVDCILVLSKQTAWRSDWWSAAFS